MEECHRGGSPGTLPWCYCCASPLLGQGTLGSHPVSGRKTHPKPQQVAPSARQVVPEFRLGNRLQVSPNRMEIPPSVALQRLPSPLRDARVPQHPKHPGTASQRKDRKLPFPAMPAALPPKPPFPKATGRPGSSVHPASRARSGRRPAPPAPGLTAESSHPAQAEAHGGQERLPPHLASCRGTKVSAPKKKIKFKK